MYSTKLWWTETCWQKTVAALQNIEDNIGKFNNLLNFSTSKVLYYMVTVKHVNIVETVTIVTMLTIHIHSKHTILIQQFNCY